MADYIRPVVFKLGNQMFGVDIERVQSIEKEIDVVPVPNSMPYISGIVNLRGDVIPVFSLKKKFSMAEDGICENTIIISLADIKIALEVDTVMEIGDFEADHISKVPEIVLNTDTQYLDRVAESKGKLILLLDVDKLLSLDETEGIKKFTEEMQHE